MPKKGTRSAEATPLANSTTDRSPAKVMFDKIGTGKENAFRVPHRDNNSRVARELRALIQQARLDGDPIITDRDGKGYYRPNMERPEEVESVNHYIASLQHEANSRMATADAIASRLGLGGTYV